MDNITWNDLAAITQEIGILKNRIKVLEETVAELEELIKQYRHVLIKRWGGEHIYAFDK